MIWVVCIVIVVLIVAGLWWRSWRRFKAYYQAIFSDTHYEQIAAWIAEVANIPGFSDPQLSDFQQLLTDPGIAVGLSRTTDNEGDRLHFSFSQRGRHTTGAVGKRMLALTMAMLNCNKCSASLYFTRSGVHHAVLKRSSVEPWITNPVAEAVASVHQDIEFPILYDDTNYDVKQFREE